MITPVSCSAASKACTCDSAFWPVLPSTTSSTSCGAPSCALAMVRRIFFSSSIRCACVVSRPAVSAITTSQPRALPATTASKVTAAGSPPLADDLDAVADRPTPAAARAPPLEGVDRGQQHLPWPASARWRVSLPMLVVLPAPLTPTTDHRRHRLADSSGCCSGAQQLGNRVRQQRASRPSARWPCSPDAAASVLEQELVACTRHRPSAAPTPVLRRARRRCACR